VRDVKGANGFIVARVDASGNVMMGPDAGPAVGRIGNNGEIYDDDAGVHQVGRVDGEGTIWNMEYEIIGKVDAWGRVHTPTGELIGKVEKPADAGVLIFLAGLAPTKSEPGAPLEEDAALMKETLDLADEQRFPGVRKDVKPLTDRDLFMEHLRHD